MKRTDIAAFLGELDSLVKEPRKRTVSDDDLKAKAREMAARGYRFDAFTLALLRKYMEGDSLLLVGGVGTVEIASLIARTLRHIDK